MKELLKRWNIISNYEMKPIRSYSGKAFALITDDNLRYILKEKGNSLKALREYKLLSCLYNQDLPVAVPILTSSGLPYAEYGSKTFSLYPCLAGVEITDHYSKGSTIRGHNFGLAIARLHKALVKCRCIEGFSEMDLLSQIIDWAIPVIQQNHSHVSLPSFDSLIEQFREFDSTTYKLLPRQLIHRDMHPSNMLFNNGELTGIVDYDMVSQGPRIFDVCYCATSILIGGFSDLKKREQWGEIFGSLLHGYEELNRLAKEERASVLTVLIAIQLIFMAFSFETGNVSAAKCNGQALKWLLGNENRLIAHIA